MTYIDRARVLVVGPATFVDSAAVRSLHRLKLNIIHAKGITIDFLLNGSPPEVAIVYSDTPDAGMLMAISELQCWSPGIPVVVVTRELPPEWPSSCSQVDLDLELATTELALLIRLLVLLSRNRLPTPAAPVQLGSGYGLVESGAHIAYLGSPGHRNFSAQFLASTQGHEKALVLGSALHNREMHAQVGLYGAEADDTISPITAKQIDLTIFTVLLQEIIAARRAGSRNIRILSTLGDRSVDQSPHRVRLAERLWTRVCAQIPAVLVCAFGVASPQAFDCAIKTHPFVIMGDKLMRNPLCTF